MILQWKTHIAQLHNDITIELKNNIVGCTRLRESQMRTIRTSVHSFRETDTPLFNIIVFEQVTFIINHQEYVQLHLTIFLLN